MSEDKELEKMIEEWKRVWSIIKNFPQYKNKTEEDYINYIKSTYYYYQSLSEEEKKEFNKVKQEQFKKAIDAIDNRKKENKDVRQNNNK